MNDDSTSQFTRKGLATRARIVSAAARLMFEHGVANTSVEEVRLLGLSGSAHSGLETASLTLSRPQLMG